MSYLISSTWVAMSFLLLCGAHAQEQDDLFHDLLEHGLSLTDHVVFRLPPPTLQPGMSQADRQVVLEGLPGKLGWARFARDSVMAPVAITIRAISDASGNRAGHEIHNAFIVHAKLDTLRNTELMQQIFGRPGRTEDLQGVVMEELTADDLQRLDFPITPQPNESFAYLELPLLNRVLVRGVIHIQKRERPGAYEFAWRLDPRFQTHQKYAGRWTRLDRDAVGRIEQGETNLYTGCGGTMGVYEIESANEAANAMVLVESRLILHEPQEWFSGSNLLRSKLPLSMQENARSFRRRVTGR